MSRKSKRFSGPTALLFASVAAIGFGLAGGAVAQTTADTGPEAWRAKRAKAMIERLDTNKDGKVDKAEFKARRDSFFATADKNKDGVLDRDELRDARIARMIERRIAARDANKDGKLSVDEFTARERDRFARIDANKDGVVTPEEMKAAIDARRKRFQEMREKRRADREERRTERTERGDRPGMHESRRASRMHVGHGPRRSMHRMMRRADINRDGKFSKAEYDLMTDYMFLRLDRNQDGTVTLEEASFRGFRRMRGAKGWHREGRFHHMGDRRGEHRGDRRGDRRDSHHGPRRGPMMDR